MTSLNLIRDPWILGSQKLLTPAQALTEGRLQWPRADLDATCFQFLIGLLQTSVVQDSNLCSDEYDWRELADTPPDSTTIQAWFEPIADYFEMFGSCAFMQDYEEELDGDELSIHALVPEAPGENTLRKSADLVIWRQRLPDAVSLSVAAMLLYGYNLYGTRTGRGHRQGMRGEKVMVTLVEPDRPRAAETVWARVWANVLPYNRWVATFGPSSWDEKRIFPWASATRTSRNGETITPNDVHPLQAYWQMPRRIRLVPSSTGECGLSGTNGPVVQSFIRATHGPDYQGWRHPLTSYRHNREGDWVPMRLPSTHLGYQHWAGVAVAGRADSMPALVVSDYLETRAKPDELLRIRCFGWLLSSDGDSGAWVDSTVPLVVTQDRQRFAREVNLMLEAAQFAQNKLSGALKSVQANSKLNPGESTLLYARTENEFYERVRLIATEEDSSGTRRDWQIVLVRGVLELFDLVAASLTHDQLKLARARARLLRSMRSRQFRQTLELPDAA